MQYINTYDYFKISPLDYQAFKGLKRYSLKEALMSGQAPHKGLYIPEKFSKPSEDLIKSFKGMQYSEIAFRVLYPYFSELPEPDFKKIVLSAYRDIKIPVKELYPNIYILELFKNWTLAFKDFAAQLLANIVEYYVNKDNIKLNVMVGTSGDTGPAINRAFYGKKNIIVFCLFPAMGVTEEQRKQMTTLGDNIIPIEVDGDFHACQEMAKSVLEDEKFGRFNATSANSINWGRFIPQAVFSYYVYSRIADYPEEINISIPTGNAGHIGSNFICKRDIGGLPINKFIAPHNENNYLVRMLEEGKEDVKVFDTVECLSNAMNVKKPNNIPRILYIFKRDINKMRDIIYPYTIDDEITEKTIKKVYNETGYILDVHSSVAIAGTFRYIKEHPEDKNKTAVFLTADPAKFSDKIEKILGEKPDIPNILKERIEAKEKKVYRIPAFSMDELFDIINKYQ